MLHHRLIWFDAEWVPFSLSLVIVDVDSATQIPCYVTAVVGQLILFHTLDNAHQVSKSTMLVEFILGFAVASFAWYLMTRLPANYPPTPPIRLPILGHAHYLLWIKDTKRTSALYEMFKRYSKNGVLTLHIGTERVTMIGKHLL